MCLRLFSLAPRMDILRKCPFRDRGQSPVATPTFPAEGEWSIVRSSRRIVKDDKARVRGAGSRAGDGGTDQGLVINSRRTLKGALRANQPRKRERATGANLPPGYSSAGLSLCLVPHLVQVQSWLVLRPNIDFFSR